MAVISKSICMWVGVGNENQEFRFESFADSGADVRGDNCNYRLFRDGPQLVSGRKASCKRSLRIECHIVKRNRVFIRIINM